MLVLIFSLDTTLHSKSYLIFVIFHLTFFGMGAPIFFFLVFFWGGEGEAKLHK